MTVPETDCLLSENENIESIIITPQTTSPDLGLRCSSSKCDQPININNWLHVQFIVKFEEYSVSRPKPFCSSIFCVADYTFDHANIGGE